MSKPTLSELQRWMLWKISGTETKPEPRPSCELSVADQPPISRDERIDIYGHAYVARLVEVLEDDFESVARILGEDA
ncbi:MAG: putative DNA-binding domain-containing protein, partial [Bdellovibrionia bacterium]